MSALAERLIVGIKVNINEAIESFPCCNIEISASFEIVPIEFELRLKTTAKTIVIKPIMIFIAFLFLNKGTKFINNIIISELTNKGKTGSNMLMITNEK